MENWTYFKCQNKQKNFFKGGKNRRKKTNNNLNIKNFKFKVNIKSINKENTDLILDGKNIDYLREALIEIFQNVKKTFKRMKALRIFKLICLLMDSKNFI